MNYSPEYELFNARFAIAQGIGFFAAWSSKELSFLERFQLRESFDEIYLELMTNEFKAIRGI